MDYREIFLTKSLAGGGTPGQTESTHSHKNSTIIIYQRNPLFDLYPTIYVTPQSHHSVTPYSLALPPACHLPTAP